MKGGDWKKICRNISAGLIKQNSDHAQLTDEGMLSADGIAVICSSKPVLSTKKTSIFYGCKTVSFLWVWGTDNFLFVSFSLKRKQGFSIL